jgi:hypothetical protein
MEGAQRRIRRGEEAVEELKATLTAEHEKYALAAAQHREREGRLHQELDVSAAPCVTKRKRRGPLRSCVDAVGEQLSVRMILAGDATAEPIVGARAAAGSDCGCVLCVHRR